MHTINLNDNPHNFDKLNLVTQIGGYDTLKCRKCGIKGRTTSLSTISVKGSYKKEKVDNCTRSQEDLRKANISKVIIITACTAHGAVFANLTPNSEHSVIEAPENQTEDSKGVWVMGVSEPVRALNNEFNYKK